MTRFSLAFTPPRNIHAKLSNCPLALVDASHKLSIHLSVRLLTMKLANDRARISAVIVEMKVELAYPSFNFEGDHNHKGTDHYFC